MFHPRGHLIAARSMRRGDGSARDGTVGWHGRSLHLECCARHRPRGLACGRRANSLLERLAATFKCSPARSQDCPWRLSGPLPPQRERRASHRRSTRCTRRPLRAQSRRGFRDRLREWSKNVDTRNAQLSSEMCWRRRPDLNGDGGFADRAWTSSLLIRPAFCAPSFFPVLGRYCSPTVPTFVDTASMRAPVLAVSRHWDSDSTGVSLDALSRARHASLRVGSRVPRVDDRHVESLEASSIACGDRGAARCAMPAISVSRRSATRPARWRSAAS